MFSKTLTIAIMALTLGLTSLTPNPAKAEPTQEQAIVGLLSLITIGAIIKHRSNDDAPAPQRPAAQPNHRALPASCVRDIERRRGDIMRMMPRRCLTRANVQINRMPEACLLRVRVANGTIRDGYDVRCLRNAGFRIAHH